MRSFRKCREDSKYGYRSTDELTTESTRDHPTATVDRPVRVCREMSKYGSRPLPGGGLKRAKKAAQPRGNELLTTLPTIALIKVLKVLTSDDLLSCSLTCYAWKSRIESVATVPGANQELWSHRIEPLECPVWMRLVKHIPLNLKAFNYARRLHRGIRDKTGEYVERKKTYCQHWHRLVLFFFIKLLFHQIVVSRNCCFTKLFFTKLWLYRNVLF